MSRAPLIIQGKERNLTDAQWEKYLKLNDSWHRELDELFDSKRPSAPGSLDGMNIDRQIREINERYKAKLASMF